MRSKTTNAIAAWKAAMSAAMSAEQHAINVSRDGHNQVTGEVTGDAWDEAWRLSRLWQEAWEALSAEEKVMTHRAGLCGELLKSKRARKVERWRRSPRDGERTKR